jgi:hypothetical protein
MRNKSQIFIFIICLILNFILACSSKDSVTSIVIGNNDSASETPVISPTPTPESSPTPTPEATPTQTPDPSPTPTPTPQPTPTISSVSPNIGLTTGGLLVTITGSGFLTGVSFI